VIREWNLICVECDGPDCGLRGPITDSVLKAKQLAREEGWDVLTAYAHCPKCRQHEIGSIV
jgi:hypothetical protein